jgi:hypothetical protein
MVCRLHGLPTAFMKSGSFQMLRHGENRHEVCRRQTQRAEKGEELEFQGRTLTWANRIVDCEVKDKQFSQLIS